MFGGTLGRGDHNSPTPHRRVVTLACWASALFVPWPWEDDVQKYNLDGRAWQGRIIKWGQSNISGNGYPMHNIKAAAQGMSTLKRKSWPTYAIPGSNETVAPFPSDLTRDLA